MYKLIMCLIGLILLSACGSQMQSNLAPASENELAKSDKRQSVSDKNQYVAFTANKENIIDFESTKRRKWDGPVISDLDQDGLPDIILINHGNTLLVYWNLGGHYSQPESLLSADVHGVATADFDKDGRIEIVIAQGGGDGKRPKFPLLFEVQANRRIVKQQSMDHFEFTRGRAANFLDANNDGQLELITTAFPLPSQKDGANHFYKFIAENQRFEFATLLQQAQWMGFRMRTADFNSDGDTDILFYGGGNIVALEGKTNSTFEVVSNKVLGPLQKTKLVQSISEIDFDNDGDKDLFLARAQHQFYHQSFYNEEEKMFAFFTFKNKPQEYDLEIQGDLFIENLQLAFPDYKIFLGANKNLAPLSEDLHGHHDVSVAKKEAKGWPADTSERGIYIGHVGGNSWKLNINTGSRNAGVIHNIISAPPTQPLESYPALLLENVNGKFVDASQKLNVNIPEQTASSAVADMNNDGYQDIFITRYGDMSKQNQHFLLLNQQGSGFKQVALDSFINLDRGSTGLGASTFDYDLDGDIDIIYGNDRGLWHLLTNDLELGNANNFIGLKVGFSKNHQIDPLHANVQIKACGQQQSRTVGSTGLAFSQGLNPAVHFGLGACKSVDEITITWRNGEQGKVEAPSINQYIEM